MMLGIVTTTNATVKGLTTGKSYNIKVRAYDADTKKYGAYSNALLVNTLKTDIKSAAVTASSITLTWSKTPGASGYYVYRKTGASGSWKKIATVKGGSTVKYTDKVKSAYYYTVKPYRTSGKKTTAGLSSNAVILRALKTPTAKAESAENGIKISWKKISGATGYMIQRRSADKNGNFKGSWTNVATVGNVASYLANNGHGTYYHYRVRAIYKKNGVTSYGAYSGATSGWITYSYPNLGFFVNYNTDSTCVAIPVHITNNGKYTLRVYSAGARLRDAQYTSFNRNLYIGDEDNSFKYMKYEDIKPGEDEWVVFCVDGRKTWYDKKSRVTCKFRYDGVDYWGSFSYYYGLTWSNEFGVTGSAKVLGA